VINNLFDWCVSVLIFIGNTTGMGYELANIVIFVILTCINIIILYFVETRKK